MWILCRQHFTLWLNSRAGQQLRLSLTSISELQECQHDQGIGLALFSHTINKSSRTVFEQVSPLKTNSETNLQILTRSRKKKNTNWWALKQSVSNHSSGVAFLPLLCLREVKSYGHIHNWVNFMFIVFIMNFWPYDLQSYQLGLILTLDK